MSDSTKRYPVILFPGIAGSRLESKNYQHEQKPLWFNENKMLPYVNGLLPTGDSEEEEEENSSLSSTGVSEEEQAANFSLSIVDSSKTEADIKTDYFTPALRWRNHMKLKEDGVTPFVEKSDRDKFNREAPELDGVRSLGYYVPEKEPLDKEYYEPLINRLVKEKGYEPNINLIGHPYDWRLAPKALEERYGTFTNLKRKIERLYNKYDLPVVLIAHSMGNRLVQYFLNWIEKEQSNGSLDWINKYIHRYIAISPPWLGAPQAIYRLSDSPILLPAGAEKQIGLKGMKNVLQSFSSIPWLLPVTENHYKYFNTPSFGYYKENRYNTDDISKYEPITVKYTLEQAEAQKTTLAHLANFYKDDSLITDATTGIIGSELIKCPNVNKLDVIYSTGFDTPVGAYYEYRDDLSDLALKRRLMVADELEHSEPYRDKPGLVIRGGIILETPRTKQQIELDFSDGSPQENSGDLVVPYGSLTYFKQWRKDDQNKDKSITGHEFSATATGQFDPTLNHNQIVTHESVITRIINLLSDASVDV
ncbi:MAG: hypothetical protein NHB32_06770 [Fischerella sp. CENA71]|nr:hypothetical protein [Fischerella sp. CENA71]